MAEKKETLPYVVPVIRLRRLSFWVSGFEGNLLEGVSKRVLAACTPSEVPRGLCDG